MSYTFEHEEVGQAKKTLKESFELCKTTFENWGKLLNNSESNIALVKEGADNSVKQLNQLNATIESYNDLDSKITVRIQNALTSLGKTAIPESNTFGFESEAQVEDIGDSI